MQFPTLLRAVVRHLGRVGQAPAAGDNDAAADSAADGIAFIVAEVDFRNLTQGAKDLLELAVSFRQNFLGGFVRLGGKDKGMPAKMYQFASDLERRQYVVDCAGGDGIARHSDMLGRSFVLREC